MTAFVYLFRSPKPAPREAIGTPERAQQSMQTWMAWIRSDARSSKAADRWKYVQ